MSADNSLNPSQQNKQRAAAQRSRQQKQTPTTQQPQRTASARQQRASSPSKKTDLQRSAVSSQRQAAAKRAAGKSSNQRSHTHNPNRPNTVTTSQRKKVAPSSASSSQSSQAVSRTKKNVKQTKTPKQPVQLTAEALTEEKETFTDQEEAFLSSNKGKKKKDKENKKVKNKKDNVPLDPDAPLLPQVPKQNNKPGKIKTKHLFRNKIIALILVLVLLLSTAFYLIFVLDVFHQPANTNSNSLESTDINGSNEQRTIDNAKQAIDSYYDLLAAGDVDNLRSLGFEAAAQAISLRWLDALEYRINATAISTDVTEFPTPVGTYAGNPLYAIADFFVAPPEGVIHSIVTGTTGCLGWIYYDMMTGRWVIVDPTIPTATQAPEAGNVAKVSENQEITIQMQCPGAFSNPWWAYTMLSVEVISQSTTEFVTIQPQPLDNGITTVVPESLTAGVPPATAQQQVVNQSTNTNNANANSNTNSNTNAPTTTTVIVPSRAQGVCIIYRGTLDNFSFEKIGASPLRIDGNIGCLNVQAGTENLSPVFIIGTANTEEIQKLLNEQERENYDASAERIAQLEAENARLAEEAAQRQREEQLAAQQPQATEQNQNQVPQQPSTTAPSTSSNNNQIQMTPGGL